MASHISLENEILISIIASLTHTHKGEAETRLGRKKVQPNFRRMVTSAEGKRRTERTGLCGR
jgi:hypothetical protein